MTAPMLLDGAMHGAAFLAYVEQVLVPTLRLGDIVVTPPTFAAASALVIQRGKALRYPAGLRASPCCATSPHGLKCRTDSSSRWPKNGEQRKTI
jgi:hypothetical protein